MLDRTKEPGSIGEPLFLDVVAALSRGARRRRAGGHAAGDRRPLRPVVEGVHAGHGRRRVRGARAASGRGGGSPSASTTTSRARACPTTPRSTSSRPTRSARCSSAWASDGTVGANKNTIKILGAEERLHAQGYFVYDSKKSGSQTVSHLRFGPRPIRAPYLVRAGELRRLPSVRAARPGRRARPAPRPARRCCSTAARARRGVGRAVAPGPGADPRQGHRRVRDRRRADRPRGRPRRAHQHRAADLLLRDLRRAAARARRSTGSRRRSPRPTAGAAPRSCSATTRRSTARSRGCTGSSVPATATATRELPPHGARARARVRPHRHRGDDGRPRRRAAGQRAAGGRHLPERHDGVREAQHLRAGRRLGSGPVHPVRQLQLRLPAQRDPLAATTTGPARGRAGGVPVGAAGRAGLPDTRYTLQVYVEDCTGCGLCVEACPVVGAGRPGTQGDQPRAARAARRPPSARTSRSSRRCPAERPVAGRLRHGARHPVPASRCSSSPARARAAARRRTSSCSRSCSATG